MIKYYNRNQLPSSYPRFTFLDVMDDIQYGNLFPYGPYPPQLKTWVKTGLKRLIERGIIILIQSITSGQSNSTYEIVKFS